MTIVPEIVERPNRSQAKRETAAVLAFTERLVRLNAKQSSQLDLPSEVRDALDELPRINSKPARARHIKHIRNLICKSEHCAAITALNLDRL